MKDTKTFPNVPGDLIAELENLYPDKLPANQNITLSEVNILQGQQMVIRFLRTIHERQNKNILEST